MKKFNLNNTKRKFIPAKRKFIPVLTTVTTPIILNIQKNIRSKTKLDITNIFFTKQLDLINQYYKLKKYIDKNDKEQIYLSYKGDNCDKHKHIIVAMATKDRLVGGGTVTFFDKERSSSNKAFLLNKKYINPESTHHLEVNLQNIKYGKISDLIIKKEFKNSSLLNRMFSLIASYCITKNAKSIIGTFDMKHSQSYRNIFENLGFDSKIIDDCSTIQEKHHNNTDISSFIIKL